MEDYDTGAVVAEIRSGTGIMSGLSSSSSLNPVEVSSSSEYTYERSESSDQPDRDADAAIEDAAEEGYHKILEKIRREVGLEMDTPSSDPAPLVKSSSRKEGKESSSEPKRKDKDSKRLKQQLQEALAAQAQLTKRIAELEAENHSFRSKVVMNNFKKSHSVHGMSIVDNKGSLELNLLETTLELVADPRNADVYHLTFNFHAYNDCFISIFYAASEIPDDKNKKVTVGWRSSVREPQRIFFRAGENQRFRVDPLEALDVSQFSRSDLTEYNENYFPVVILMESVPAENRLTSLSHNTMCTINFDRNGRAMIRAIRQKNQYTLVEDDSKTSLIATSLRELSVMEKRGILSRVVAIDLEGSDLSYKNLASLINVLPQCYNCSFCRVDLKDIGVSGRTDLDLVVSRCRNLHTIDYIQSGEINEEDEADKIKKIAEHDNVREYQVTNTYEMNESMRTSSGLELRGRQDSEGIVGVLKYERPDLGQVAGEVADLADALFSFGLDDNPRRTKRSYTEGSKRLLRSRTISGHRTIKHAGLEILKGGGLQDAKVRLEVLLHIESIELVPDSSHPALYHINFKFDAYTDCVVTVFLGAKEILDEKNPRVTNCFMTLDGSTPRGMMYPAGLNHGFSAPLDVSHFTWAEMSQHTENYYPIVIQLETVAPSNRMTILTHTTRAKLVETNSVLCLKLIRQKNQYTLVDEDNRHDVAVTSMRELIVFERKKMLDKISSIDLIGADLNPTYVSRLAEILDKCTRLQSLQVSLDDLGSDGRDLVANAVNGLTNLMDMRFLDHEQTAYILAEQESRKQTFASMSRTRDSDVSEAASDDFLLSAPEQRTTFLGITLPTLDELLSHEEEGDEKFTRMGFSSVSNAVSSDGPRVYKDEQGVKLDALVHERSVQLYKDFNSENSYQLAFSFDLLTEASLTIYYGATEIYDTINTKVTTGWAATRQTVSQVYGRGLMQRFRTSKQESLDMNYFSPDQMTNYSEHYYPIVIHFETIIPSNRMTILSHFTLCHLFLNENKEMDIKVIRQKNQYALVEEDMTKYVSVNSVRELCVFEKRKLLDHVITIDLSDSDLTSHNVGKVAPILSRCNNMTKLKFDYNDLGLDGVRMFAVAIASLENLMEVEVYNENAEELKSLGLSLKPWGRGEDRPVQRKERRVVEAPSPVMMPSLPKSSGDDEAVVALIPSSALSSTLNSPRDSIASSKGSKKKSKKRHDESSSKHAADKPKYSTRLIRSDSGSSLSSFQSLDY